MRSGAKARPCGAVVRVVHANLFWVVHAVQPGTLLPKFNTFFFCTNVVTVALKRVAPVFSGRLFRTVQHTDVGWLKLQFKKSSMLYLLVF